MSNTHRLFFKEETIPGTEARLTLPMGNLLDLPEGAGYEARDGRGRVRIERRGDGFEITGTCDSIARRCTFLEELHASETHRADSLQRELSALKWMMEGGSTRLLLDQEQTECESRKPPNLFGWALIWLTTGIIAGGILVILAEKKLNINR